MDKSTFILDVDDTISFTPVDENGKGMYHLAEPNMPTIKKIKKLYKLGNRIVFFTARGMRTFGGDVDKIKEYHSKTLIDWLEKYQIPYNELIFGKPWGPNVYYVDDKNLTLNQFLLYEYEDYSTILDRNTKQLK
jgi:capsule biosynthesis phosphatase